jgi:hypothetical protein
VTTLAQTTASISRRRDRFTPRSAIGLALAGLLALIALSLLAPPAGAVVTTVGSAKVGLQPRNTESFFDGNGELGASFANQSGDPVMHSTSTYSIFWDPTVNYHGDWQELINNFLEQVGLESGSLSNVFSVYEQYTDRSNKPAAYQAPFKGSYIDSDAYPTTGQCADPDPFELADRVEINKVHSEVCLTDKQLQQELQKFIPQHKLATGMNTIFYLLTPPGVAVCLDAGGPTGHCSDYTGSEGGTSYKNSFCSYHSDVNPGGLATGDANTIVYAAIPWTAGGLGDPQLKPADQRKAVDCQDGGFDPSSTPSEKYEHIKEKTAKEEEAFEEETAEEKTATIEKEQLQAPHAEEPNQGSCPGFDGGCDKGLADLIINQVAVEQQNTVTDPLLNAWQDVAHNEASDECRNFFAPALGGSSTALERSLAGTLYNQEIGGGTYYLNTAFDRAAFTFSYPGVPCIPATTLTPNFTAPNPVNAGEPVGFDGMESAITQNAGDSFPATGEPTTTYPIYTWNFGDGTPTVTGYAPAAPSQNSPETSPCEEPWLTPCAASAFHSYQYGGTYTVTLTVRDVGGNVSSTTRQVTVVGPPPPSPESTPSAPAVVPVSPSVSAGTTSGSAAHGATTTSTTPSTAAPTATQAVVSHSLATVLKSGLVIRYSVSEQVAGRFEVLLASSIAKKLGLQGAHATGLAHGTPPQTIIAKAILVTTKAGRDTYTIRFSKATAARLHKLSKVSLMIRLVVHGGKSSTATTVLDTANLH